MISGFVAWVCFEFIYKIGVPSLVPATIISVIALVGGSLFWNKSNENRDQPVE